MANSSPCFNTPTSQDDNCVSFNLNGDIVDLGNERDTTDSDKWLEANEKALRDPLNGRLKHQRAIELIRQQYVFDRWKMGLSVESPQHCS